MHIEKKIRSKNSKPRILFVGEDIALSHVVRPLVLADAIKNEYEVVFATGDRFAHLVKEYDIPYQKIWTVPADIFINRIAKGQDAWTAEDLSREVQEDLALAKKVSPDLVIGDLRWSLGISSEVSQIPYISLLNAHWSPYYTLMPPPPEFPFVKILGVKLSSLLMPRVMPLILKKLAAPFNVVRKQYGLTRIIEYRDICVRASWVGYLDIPSLGPTQDPPASHIYIGPVHWSPNVSFPNWWDRLPNDKPVIYVSMGSSGKVTFINELIDELSRMDLTIMLATSGRFEQNGFPDNIFAAEYLPGIEACRRSNLIVCNGGTGAIYQAILSGTPVLGIPTNGDQYFAMGSVEKQGAGLLIRSTHVNRKRIRSAVSRLMSDQSFKHRCDELNTELSDYIAISRFQELINSLWKK